MNLPFLQLALHCRDAHTPQAYRAALEELAALVAAELASLDAPPDPAPEAKPAGQYTKGTWV